MTTETLTVVRETTQTIPFVSTTAISGQTAITVRKGTAGSYTFHYYAPLSDTLGGVIADGNDYTWDVVQKLGSDGYIQTSSKSIALPTSIPIGTDDFSISVKINIDSISSFQRIVTSTTGIFGSNTLCVRVNNDGTMYAYCAGTSLTTPALTTSTWYKFECSRDGNVLTAKLDDAVIGTSEFSSSLDSVTTLLGYYSTAEYFSGKISSIKINSFDLIPIKYGTTYAFYDNGISSSTVIYVPDSGTFTGGGTQSELTYPHTVTTPTVKIWNGASWVDGTPYVWNGSEWKVATNIYVWGGSAWKEST